MSQQTHGGFSAHLVRRLIHLSSLCIPWLYFSYAQSLADKIHLTPHALIYICLALVTLLEIFRLSAGWVMFGQRPYERKQVSAFAWGIYGMAVVLLGLPPAYAIPIISAYALGDPFIGELRTNTLWPKSIIFILGVIFIALIWFICGWWLGTPLWLALPLSVITVAVEWPRFKWMDDNFLMQFIPFLIIISILK